MVGAGQQSLILTYMIWLCPDPCPKNPFFVNLIFEKLPHFLKLSLHQEPINSYQKRLVESILVSRSVLLSLLPNLLTSTNAFSLKSELNHHLLSSRFIKSLTPSSVAIFLS